jgi:rSAM/selenodomain-associated transferase 1
VVVLVGAREPGRVKTRHAAVLGDGPALEIYRRMAEHTVAVVRSLAGDAALRIHFTPAEREAEVAEWLGPDAHYRAQCEGDLGQRMEHAFAEAFAEGFDRVLIIGSDLPGLRAGLLRDALEGLERRGAVLGPSADGGYWLLGLREPCPAVFHGMPWSTPEVGSITLSRMTELGMQPALLPILADVDEVADLPAGWLDQR